MIPKRLLETMRTGLRVTAVVLAVSGAAYAESPSSAQAAPVVEVASPNQVAVILLKITELSSSDPTVAHTAFRYLRRGGSESLGILNKVLLETKDEPTREKITAVIKAIQAGHQCVEECGRG